MTAQNPPLYLQAADHPAEDFRHIMTTANRSQPGVAATTDLAVTEKSGTADMSVDVAGGSVYVAGTEATYQGLYLCHNRGTSNLVVSASDVTNDRYDLIVAQVEDSDYSGAVDAWKLAVVTGTPAATPLFPAVPDNAFVLATVLVGNGVSSIVNADITDIRAGTDTDGTTVLTNYGLAPAPGPITCLSSARPQSPVVGMQIFESDTLASRTWNGSSWQMVQAPSNFRTAKVYRDSSNQGIANATYDFIYFDGTVNIGGMWARAAVLTDGLEALEDGLVFVSAGVRWSGNASGQRIITLSRNGSLSTESPVRQATIEDPGNTGVFVQTVSGVFPVAAGDELSVAVYQTSGGALSVLETQDYTYLSCTYL